MSFIEDKVAVFFIEPQYICASDEDSADKDGSEIIDNLTGARMSPQRTS